MGIYDFGGSTFTFTLLEYGEGVFEVKKTVSNLNCGGDNMDALISELIIREFSA